MISSTFKLIILFSTIRWQKIKSEKRQKDQQKKQKMSESRKHLANVR